VTLRRRLTVKPFPLASVGRGTVLLAAQLSRPSPPCQGQAASGRFASLDTAATARGTAAIEEDGEGPGHGDQRRPNRDSLGH
jgi:hypothetical protein